MSYDGCFQLECFAKVLAVHQMVVNGATIAVDISLDRTTMHPQGGGQPSDVGVISSLENTTTTPIKRSVSLYFFPFTLIKVSDFSDASFFICFGNKGNDAAYNKKVSLTNLQ